MSFQEELEQLREQIYPSTKQLIQKLEEKKHFLEDGEWDMLTVLKHHIENFERRRGIDA